MAKFVLALAVVSGLLLHLPGAVTGAAGPPVAGCGTFSVLPPTVLESRPAGGNIILTDVVTGSLTGLFNGTVTAERRIVLHPNGTITGQATEEFSGSVAGQTGTGGLVFRLLFTGDAAAGTFGGSFTILSGTGALAGLRGQGTFDGFLATGAGTYCGQIVVAP